MTTENALQEPHESNLVAHEESDVSVGAVIGFGVGLVVIGGVIYILLALLFGLFTREAGRAPRMFPLSAQQQEQLPPEPRLQANPRADLERLRVREAAVLGSYGWVDKDAGIARIPIEEAMKLTIQRGLPTR